MTLNQKILHYLISIQSAAIAFKDESFARMLSLRQKIIECQQVVSVEQVNDFEIWIPLMKAEIEPLVKIVEKCHNFVLAIRVLMGIYRTRLTKQDENETQVDFKDSMASTLMAMSVLMKECTKVRIIYFAKIDIFTNFILVF